MKIIKRFVLALIWYLANTQCLCGQESATIRDDLSLLTQVIPVYETSNSSVGDAINLALSQTIGLHRIPIFYKPLSAWENDNEQPKISLSLKKVPVHHLFNTICDLSHSRWRVVGWPNAPAIEIKKFEELDDTELLHETKIYEINHLGVQRLKLTAESSVPSIIEKFKRLGVEFPFGSTLAWNFEYGILAVRNSVSELNVIEGIIRIINNGITLE